MKHYHDRTLDVGFTRDDDPIGEGLTEMAVEALLALPEVDWVRQGWSVYTSDGHHLIPHKDGAA